MAGNATSISGNQMILLDSIFRYSRDNLALVNIYIKPPVVTRILRDQRYVTQNKIFSLLAKIGGFAAIFARSGSHQTIAVALHIPTLSRKSSYFYLENLH